MSTSLKVVSWAAVFWDSFRRSATVLRSRVIATTSSRAALWRGPDGAGRGAAAGLVGAGFQRAQHVALGDAAILAGAGDGGGGDAGFLGDALGRRHGGDIVLWRRPVWRGQERAWALRPWRQRAAATGAAGLAAEAPALPSAMEPSSAPTCTVSPALTEMDSIAPSAGAGTSTVTLSVSSSSSGSSRLTASPSFLNQRATVASVTDSPMAGTLISMVMTCASRRVCARLVTESSASLRKAASSARCCFIRPAAVEAYSGRPT